MASLQLPTYQETLSLAGNVCRSCIVFGLLLPGDLVRKYYILRISVARGYNSRR